MFLTNFSGKDYMNYIGFEIAVSAVSGTYSDCSYSLDCSCSLALWNLCYCQYTVHIVGIVSILIRVSTLIGVPLVRVALVAVAIIIVVGSIIRLVVVIIKTIIIVRVILLIVVIALVVALIIIVLPISLIILLPT